MNSTNITNIKHYTSYVSFEYNDETYAFVNGGIYIRMEVCSHHLPGTVGSQCHECWEYVPEKIDNDFYNFFNKLK
jgi:hypothetical protein